MTLRHLFLLGLLPACLLLIHSRGVRRSRAIRRLTSGELFLAPLNRHASTQIDAILRGPL